MGYLPSAYALVGRVSELTALTASLDRATAGHGSLTFLTGVQLIFNFNVAKLFR